MNIRIQTYGKQSRSCLTRPDTNIAAEGTSAIEALQKGLQDLQELCDVVAEKFWTSRNDFMGESTPLPSHA